MHIGIFETGHFEVAYTVARLFDDGHNTITLFVYPESHRQLQFLLGKDQDRFQWVVKKEQESKRAFIRRMQYEISARNISLLYLNTVTDNFISYAGMIARLPGLRVILTLHDINSYTQAKPGFGIRRWVRYIGKKRLLRRVQEFNVISSTMKDYLQQQLPAGKIIYQLPGAVFEAKKYLPPAAPHHHIQIVVPGSIDERRRNYDHVFALLEQCHELAIRIKIVLLGGSQSEYGSRILAKCRDYAKQYDDLIFYDTAIVDQPEFDRMMQSAHFIWSPSVMDTVITDHVREQYGISIVSGNVSDMIRHARPGIVPGALAMPGSMEKSLVRYDAIKEITPLLRAIQEQPSQYGHLLQAALQSSRYDTIEAVKSRHPAIWPSH